MEVVPVPLSLRIRLNALPWNNDKADRFLEVRKVNPFVEAVGVVLSDDIAEIVVLFKRLISHQALDEMVRLAAQLVVDLVGKRLEPAVAFSRELNHLQAVLRAGHVFPVHMPVAWRQPYFVKFHGAIQNVLGHADMARRNRVECAAKDRNLCLATKRLVLFLPGANVGKRILNQFLRVDFEFAATSQR